MKKLIPLLLSLLILTSCKNGDIDPDMYKYAESAIKVCDDYIDNEISYEVADQKLDGLHKQAEKWYDAHNNDPNYHYDNISTYFAIGRLDNTLALEHLGSYTYSDLLEARNELADYIGMSERD